MSYSPGEDLRMFSHLTEGGGQTLAVRPQSMNILNKPVCVCVGGVVVVVCVLAFYSLRLQGQISWMSQFMAVY